MVEFAFSVFMFSMACVGFLWTIVLFNWFYNDIKRGKKNDR